MRLVILLKMWSDCSQAVAFRYTFKCEIQWSQKKRNLLQKRVKLKWVTRLDRGTNCGTLFGKVQLCTDCTRSVSPPCNLSAFFGRLCCKAHTFAFPPSTWTETCASLATECCCGSCDLRFLFLCEKPSMSCFARSSLKLIISRFPWPRVARWNDSKTNALQTDRLNRNQKM